MGNPIRDNKWTLNISTTYIIKDCEEATIINSMAIPPTSGDRIDIIGQSGKYYYNMTKKKFMERVSKEDYINSYSPNLSEEEMEIALKITEWTPRKINDSIAFIIDINQGNITIKTK